MNIFRTFLELDRLNESSSVEESFIDRQELIDKLKALGKNYYFEKYSDKQLYRMLEKAQAEKEYQDNEKDYYSSRVEKPICDVCGRELTDGGFCLICQDGLDDLEESVFDSAPSKSHWVMDTKTSTSAPATGNTSVSSSSISSHSTNKPIVTITYDNKAHKLRARADDGIHGEANVAFPNSLRNSEGQQYEVDELIWNGKNYRVSGNIKPISVPNTQNINETFNEEKNEMNFQTILEELDKLYESDLLEEAEKEVEVASEAEVAEASEKTLTEAADEEVFVEDEPIVDDEVDDEADNEAEVEEPKQLILECAKCGGLVIKAEADVKVDAETDLADVEESCQYCEATEGYKIIGTVAPYEAVEDETLEEGIFSKKPSYALIVKYTDGGEANGAKSDWYCQATSSDQTKLNKEAERLKTKPGWSGVELKVVDMKTAKSLVHKDEFAGAVDFDAEVPLTEKNDANFNNKKMDFDTEVEKIAGGKALADIAADLVNQLRNSVDKYKYYEKKANPNADQMSLTKIFDAKAEVILKLYVEIIKRLKKPTNFIAPYLCISTAINKVLGDYVSQSDIPGRVQKYDNILTKVNEIQTDKKVKVAALKDFYERVIYSLNSDYQELKKELNV